MTCVRCVGAGPTSQGVGWRATGEWGSFDVSGDTANAAELHVMTDRVHSWDTKVRCSCGFESISKAEMWKHQAEALRALLEAR